MTERPELPPSYSVTETPGRADRVVNFPPLTDEEILTYLFDAKAYTFNRVNPGRIAIVGSVSYQAAPLREFARRVWEQGFEAGSQVERLWDKIENPYREEKVEDG